MGAGDWSLAGSRQKLLPLSFVRSEEPEHTSSIAGGLPLASMATERKPTLLRIGLRLTRHPRMGAAA
jgi:hypothetical protein